MSENKKINFYEEFYRQAKIELLKRIASTKKKQHSIWAVVKNEGKHHGETTCYKCGADFYEYDAVTHPRRGKDVGKWSHALCMVPDLDSAPTGSVMDHALVLTLTELVDDKSALKAYAVPVLNSKGETFGKFTNPVAHRATVDGELMDGETDRLTASIMHPLVWKIILANKDKFSIDLDRKYAKTNRKFNQEYDGDLVTGDRSEHRIAREAFGHDITEPAVEAVITEAKTETEETEAVEEKPKEEPKESSTNSNAGSSVNKLVDEIAEVSKSKVMSSVKDVIEEQAKEIIKEVLGDVRPKTSPLEIKIQGKDEIKKIKHPHPKMKELLEAVSCGEDVYLYGPPASGKTTACKLVAEALGRDFGSLTFDPQTSTVELKGYRDIQGDYCGTEFQKLFSEGGIFLGDEQDNSSPATISCLNQALANGFFTFPLHTEPTKRHPDFTYISAGNTSGYGGDLRYPDRRRFDSAFMDRLSYIEWNYCKDQEQAITLEIGQQHGASADDCLSWLSYVWSLRDYCEETHPDIVVSPRASYRGVKRVALGRDFKDISKLMIFRGIDQDIVDSIAEAVKGDR